MDLTSERRIAAPIERVWQTLNDPEALRRLVPGCLRLERSSEREVAFTVGAPAVPAPSELAGHVHVVEVEPHSRLRVAFEGESPTGVFARGEAVATLAALGESTALGLSLEAHGGGAAWGGPDEARRLMDGFLDGLVSALGGSPARELGAEGVAGVIAAAAAPTEGQGTLAQLLAAIPAAPFGYPRVAWVGGFLFLCIFLLIFSAYVI